MEFQSSPGREDEGATRLARGLGWFSVGLGVAELAAPRLLSRLVGSQGSDVARKAVLALGAREVAQGVAILSRPRKPLRVWSRLAGDALDLALLAWAMRGKQARTGRLTAAMAVVVGVAALDVVAGRRASRNAVNQPVPALSITINRPPAEVYAYWSSLEGADVSNVTFTLAPDGVGTEIRVELPATGLVGSAAGKLFGKKQPTARPAPAQAGARDRRGPATPTRASTAAASGAADRSTQKEPLR